MKRKLHHCRILFFLLFSLCVVYGCAEKAGNRQKLVLTDDVLEMSVGETKTIAVEMLPDGVAEEDLVWDSYDESVALVSDNGIVEAVAAGECVVTVRCGQYGASCRVFVKDVPVNGLIMDRTKYEMSPGETVHLNVIAMPNGTTPDGIVWSSSDEGIAVVSEEGIVSSIALGEAAISATFGEFEVECAVTVRAAKTAIGDYLYSDGSFSSVLDSEKTVVGIVFWAGNPGKDDRLLREEHPQCTNGLAVSVKEIKTGWQTNWGTASTSVADWVSSNLSGYESIGSGTTIDANMNRHLGYNNTRAIQLYNEGNPGVEVDAVSAIKAFEKDNPAPESSSGWYLPSIKEVSLMCGGKYEGNIWDIDHPMVTIRNIIASRLASVPEAVPLNESSGYWSSTECGKGRAFGVFFMTGMVMDTYKDYQEDGLRYVVAF